MDVADARARDLGLAAEEVAFYDAVAASGEAVYDEPFLRDLVHDVVQAIKRNLKVAWTEPHRDQVRAEIRAAVKRVLRRRGVREADFEPFIARFLHVNPRHHSLAFIQTGKSAVHHVMMELFSFDDVGQGYDLACGEDGRVAVTMGRHTSDFITSFYTRTPSAFMVEYGWGARTIDIDRWQAYERKEGPSIWGHDRRWLSPEDNAKARALRLANAAAGYRQPVQVIDGNYQVMPGVCPWWDSVTSRTAARK